MQRGWHTREGKGASPQEGQGPLWFLWAVACRLGTERWAGSRLTQSEALQRWGQVGGEIPGMGTAWEKAERHQSWYSAQRVEGGSATEYNNEPEIDLKQTNTKSVP